MKAKEHGGVWYQLREEREDICKALLRVGVTSDQNGRRDDDNELHERLRLLDDALDRLMAGTYGYCVICGRWIEDNKLHADPALPFCCACQRTSKAKTVPSTAEANPLFARVCRYEQQLRDSI